MEKAYRNISYLFISLLLISFTGFFQTYIKQFPTFTQSVTAHHFHATLLVLWIALLIAQPLLIRARKVELHRLIGKASYGLVPLIVLSILMVTQVQYRRGIDQQSPVTLIDYGLYMTFVDLVPFLTLYGLAMWYRRLPAIHMRYIIACSVIFFNPAFGRINIIYLGMAPEQGVLLSYVYCDSILLGFLIYDIVKHKPYRPYLYSLLFLLVCHSSLLYAPFWPVWHRVANSFAQTFF
ncbi:hypothetical protein [Spirosoma endbachense]|uniref:Uncharacterized protein n=1 Tax=Spirosoma endbachense TaxID=2666025 RepID=A0A6P1VPG2_9BACT|nr:hypothetical protein [Spirosoma endbachense]QHV94318.1 hypothetical protein GJR95_04470 [Spirosoma endbachense]